MAADSDPSVRLDLMKLATELVNDRFEKKQEHAQNEALLSTGNGEYIAIEDNRSTEVQRITNALFKLYETNGGKEMLDAIEQAYELSDQKYQAEVTRRRFNAIKTDPTGTEVLSRVTYELPTDAREEDIYNFANQIHSTLTVGGEGDLKVTIQTTDLGEEVEVQNDIVPVPVDPVDVKHLAF